MISRDSSVARSTYVAFWKAFQFCGIQDPQTPQRVRREGPGGWTCSLSQYSVSLTRCSMRSSHKLAVATSISICASSRNFYYLVMWGLNMSESSYVPYILIKQSSKTCSSHHNSLENEAHYYSNTHDHHTYIHIIHVPTATHMHMMRWDIHASI